MTDTDVKNFLRSSSIQPVRLAIEMVNLTDKERLAVELCGLRGLTYDKAAEEINCIREVDSIKRWYKSAKTKLLKAWDGVGWIEAILKYEKSN